MTKEEKKVGLEIFDPFLDWAKRVSALSGITIVLFGVGWTLYAEPKIKEKIDPLKHDIMYIKLILEETVSGNVLDKVKKKQKRIGL